MSRIKYYKLAGQASMFYDAKSTLKVTNGVPGKTDNPTKGIKDAVRGGHITEINEGTYSEMMNKLPDGTKKAILKEQKSAILGKPEASKEKEKEKDEDEEEEKDEDEEEEKRENLEKRVKDLNLSKKETKRVMGMDDEDMEEYLKDNEEKD